MPQCCQDFFLQGSWPTPVSRRSHFCSRNRFSSFLLISDPSPDPGCTAQHCTASGAPQSQFDLLHIHPNTSIKMGRESSASGRTRWAILYSFSETSGAATMGPNRYAVNHASLPTLILVEWLSFHNVCTAAFGPCCRDRIRKRHLGFGCYELQQHRGGAQGAFERAPTCRRFCVRSTGFRARHGSSW